MAAKNLSLVCMISIFLLFGFSAERKPKKSAEDDQTTIRASVDMVSLPAVVTNKDGKRITDLTKDDFRVYENGIQQEIAGFAATDEPVDVALLLDTSGSTEHELARIQNAAIEFVHQLHPDDEVAVISFADEVTLQEDFTIDRNKNEYGIKKTRSGGSTAEYEAVWLALEEVLKPIRERTALVLFTDGVDTCSRKASQKETLDLARETRATVYPVYYDTQPDLYRRRPMLGGGGYPPGQTPPIIIAPQPPVYGGPGGPGSSSSEYIFGREYLKKLAENSGGLMFDGKQDLSYAFAEIARELGSQYSIGYYSSNNKHDGKFRKVEVKVKKPDLVARTKPGYIAPKDTN
ncbi:MAG: VWA domain-containing protein [Acidobacteriota bacterium]|jgi:VWFA-related protein